MIRICLIIAVVGALAAAGISAWKVHEVIATLTTERNDFQQKWNTTTAELNTTKKNLADTKKELDSTKATLAQTQTDLKNETAKADDLDKQNTDLTATLKRTRSERDVAQQELEQWNLIGMKPDAVKGMIAELAKTKKERDTVIAENKIVLADRNNWRDKYFSIVNPDSAPQLPAGLKGRVISVDPKYGFVVLDIGLDQGVLKRGEMMIDHEGKLIGKIRITNVDKDRCIGNLLPEWNRGEVMEGDLAID